jgi:hypothetical protein
MLRLHPALAPINAGVFPLTTKDGRPEMAMKLADDLRQRSPVFHDDAGRLGASIGRRMKSARRSHCCGWAPNAGWDGDDSLARRLTAVARRCRASRWSNPRLPRFGETARVDGLPSVAAEPLAVTIPENVRRNAGTHEQRAHW